MPIYLFVCDIRACVIRLSLVTTTKLQVSLYFCGCVVALSYRNLCLSVLAALELRWLP